MDIRKGLLRMDNREDANAASQDEIFVSLNLRIDLEFVLLFNKVEK